MTTQPTQPRRRWSITCGTCGYKYGWTGDKKPVPPCPQCHPPKRQQTLDAANEQRRKYEVAAALEQCERIEEMCEDMPDRGIDFAIGVAEQTQGIRETIEKTQRVTEGQQSALDNMEAGLNRWLDR